MAKKKTTTTEKYDCFQCTESKSQSEYYESRSVIYIGFKRLPVCKKCVNDLYIHYLDKYQDKKQAMYNLCEKLDMPFHQSIFDKASEKEGIETSKHYFRVLNSFRDKNGYADDFDGGERISSNTTNTIEFEDSSNSEIEEFKVTNDMVRFFGRGFEVDDYYYLANEYEDWVTRYECDSKAMEGIIKQICLTNLDIEKRRTNGEKVDAQLKTLQDLLGSANLKPVQETGANATDQATFGTLIKKWENDKPIPDPLPEWKEKDIFQYVKVWFLGHLSKMIGLENPHSDEYENEIVKHSVETPFEESDESGD